MTGASARRRKQLIRMKSPASWLLLVGLVSFGSTSEQAQIKLNGADDSFVDQCTLVPTWTIGGEKVVSLIGHNITVIAILNSSRLFGRKQAAMLSSLRSRLYLAGFSDINFFVINSMLATENTELLRHEAANIPVFQEQPGESVRHILGAGNDHILVLDRCGRMAYQVITPFSKLIYPYVKAAILSTYKDNPCGFCKSSETVSGEEDRAALFYASDASAQSAYKNQTKNELLSQTDHYFSTLEENYGKSNQSHSERISQQQQQGEVTVRDNGLTQLFVQNVGFSETPQTLNLPLGSGKIENSETQRDHFNSSSGLMILTAQEEYDQQQHVIVPDRILNEQRPTRNLDWLESQNNRADEKNGLTEESDEESVEVVKHSKIVTTKVKTKSLDSRTPGKGALLKRRSFMNQSTVCQIPRQCNIITGNELAQKYPDSLSNVVVDNSMEELVNQTQRLFDWYQQQIENGTSSEEEYERSNILKTKIIEHYSRLLPWLNFKLAPEVIN